MWIVPTTNDPRKVNSRRWRRETRRRYPPSRRWMMSDSHLPVTILRFVYCLCPTVLPNHSNDQVGFVRVEIRIETGSKLPELSPPRIRIKTRVLRFPRAVGFTILRKRIPNFGYVLSLGRERITLGSGGNLPGERVTRFLNWPLIMQIGRLPRSRVFRGLASLRRYLIFP